MLGAIDHSVEVRYAVDRSTLFEYHCNEYSNERSKRNQTTLHGETSIDNPVVQEVNIHRSGLSQRSTESLISNIVHRSTDFIQFRGVSIEPNLRIDSDAQEKIDR